MEYGIIGWIVVGLIAGVLAKWVMPGDDPGGIIVTILVVYRVVRPRRSSWKRAQGANWGPQPSTLTASEAVGACSAMSAMS